MSLAQLSRLLPLPESDLQQMLDYASTLSKQEAVEHFNNLLGKTPQSIEFISSFNSRRQDPKQPSYASHASSSASAPASDIEAVPKHARGPKKKKPPLHALAPRQVENTTYAGTQGTAYLKKNEEDYMSKKSSTTTSPSAATFALQTPNLPPTSSSKPPPSAAGHLISDLLPNVTKSSKSAPVSRTSSPKPPSSSTATKVTISGGRAMQGASTTLTDLDAAIRALEISTNPSLLSSSSSETNNKKRKCDCNATRHPLLAAAPNCLNCGKVICVKEGFGPCTFCGAALLSSEEVQGMIRELRVERGREKMALDKEGHRRAGVARGGLGVLGQQQQQQPLQFSGVRLGSAGVGGGAGPTPAEGNGPVTAAGTTTSVSSGSNSPDAASASAAALAHRDKLLNFQSQNAQRTTVRDEAADFETPLDVTSRGIWASPAERARRLKKQQQVLREMEWNARPEWERRREREVVSLDIVGGKVVKRLGVVERRDGREQQVEEEEEEDFGMADGQDQNQGQDHQSQQQGAFSKNPLLGGLIKPVWKVKPQPEQQNKGKGKADAIVAGTSNEQHHDNNQDENEDESGRNNRDTRPPSLWQHRGRRVQDDYDDNEGVILDGGVYGGMVGGQNNR